MFRTLTISLVLVLVTGAANSRRESQPRTGRTPATTLCTDLRLRPGLSQKSWPKPKRPGSIFRRIGVEILWTDHSSGGSALKGNLDRGPQSLLELQLRVLDQKNVGAAGRATKTMTGLAFQGTGGSWGRWPTCSIAGWKSWPDQSLFQGTKSSDTQLLTSWDICFWATWTIPPPA